MRFTLIFLLLCVSQAAKYEVKLYEKEGDLFLMQKNMKEFCTPQDDLLDLTGIPNLICHFLPLHLPLNHTHYATFDKDNTLYFKQNLKVFTHKKKAYLLVRDEDVVKTEAFVKDLYEKRDNIVDV
tara:strand:- start:74 stop:448 length:375 start_codon:yes stop_codon:yes gene_type:complete